MRVATSQVTVPNLFGADSSRFDHAKELPLTEWLDYGQEKGLLPLGGSVTSDSVKLVLPKTMFGDVEKKAKGY